MPASDWTNMSDITDLLTVTSNNTDGLFGMVVWGLVYVVVFVSFLAAAARFGSNEPAKESLLATSSIMAVVSFLFAIIGLISSWFTVVPIIMAVIAIIMLSMRD